MPEPQADVTDRAVLTRANVDAMNDTFSANSSPKGVIELSGEPEDTKGTGVQSAGVENQEVIPFRFDHKTVFLQRSSHAPQRARFKIMMSPMSFQKNNSFRG